MSLVIRGCTVSELDEAPTMAALLDEYSLEASISGLPHPSAKVDMYKLMEASGSLNAIGAFLGDTLIGFIFVLSPVLPHYSERIAVAESFFVAKEHRKTGAGLKLLRAAEGVARDIKSCGLLVSAPIGGRLADVLPGVGYAETNRVFFRGLKWSGT